MTGARGISDVWRNRRSEASSRATNETPSSTSDGRAIQLSTAWRHVSQAVPHRDSCAYHVIFKISGVVAIVSSFASQEQRRRCAFSASTLLVGRQEEHPACKNWVMRCWCGYLSAARCRLFAYGPADATASQNPIISIQGNVDGVWRISNILILNNGL